MMDKVDKPSDTEGRTKFLPNTSRELSTALTCSVFCYFEPGWRRNGKRRDNGRKKRRRSEEGNRVTEKKRKKF
jgi:hypothetical protein